VRAWLSAAMLCLCMLCPRGALADGTDAAAAEVLFQKGRDAMVVEDYDAACQLFLESLSLEQAVGTVMNLAVCEEKRGHLTAAWERWHQALRLLDPSDDRVLFAEDQLTIISERLAHLTIRVTGASPKELTIRRDGVVLGAATLGQDLPVDPGAHEVTVESEHFEPSRYSVTLESGESAELVVSPGRRKAEADVDGPRQPAKTRRILAFTALGLGAAGVTTAVITGLLLPGQDQLVEANCPMRVCNDVGAQAVSDARLLLGLNTAGWIAAGVGVAAGTVLLVTLPKSKKKPAAEGKRQASDANADLRQEQALPALALTPTGVWLSGSF